MRRAKKIIVVVMLLLLLSPALASLLGAGAIAPIEENRIKAEFPTAVELKEAENPYTLIERWYNDRFGLRDLLIRVQHQIDCSVFCTNPDLFFAQDDYLVYQYIPAKEQIANEMLGDEQIGRLVRSYERMGEKLEARGIAFKFLFPPQKNDVLVDETADIPIVRPKPRFHDRLEAAIGESGAARWYVPVLDVLKEKNAELPVFYRSDFHWNDWGAAVGFGEVLNAYGKERGLGEIYHTSALQPAMIEDYQGGQLNNLSLIFPKRFEEYTAGMGESRVVLAENPEGGGIVHWRNEGPCLIEGSVFFIGDSYTMAAVYSFNGTNPGISDLFRDTYFCHWDYSKDILDHLPADVKLVVVEKIESSLSYAMDLIEGAIGEIDAPAAGRSLGNTRQFPNRF